MSDVANHDARMVTIGKIIGVHGVGGEVKVTSYSDVPGRFEGLTQVQVQHPSGRRTLAVVGRRRSAKGHLLRFASIETPEAARSLVGGFLQIPEERLAPPSKDCYYEYQLLGMNVRGEDGASLGVLKEVLTTTGNAVFVVEDAGGAEHLIPGTKELVRSVDVERQTMVVRPVPGLLDERDAL
jgi:16S rRNA processing protein RimM